MILGEIGLLVPSCSRGLSLKILCVRQDRNLAQLRRKQNLWGTYRAAGHQKTTGDLGRVLVPVLGSGNKVLGSPLGLGLPGPY